MIKSADAFRTISEVAEWLDTETHVLRFWESKFSQIKPVKRAGGRRYYRPKDMLIIGGIKKLLHEDGLTIKGTQRIIKDKGLNYVSNLSGQFSMFSDETMTPFSKEIGPEPKYVSILEYIKNGNLQDHNRFKLEDILNSIDHAIKKRV